MRPLQKLFYDRGNRDAVDGVQHLRLAKITSVNVEDMVADIEFLEESSGKTRVAIPMPSAYPGGGIWAVPRTGAIVIVGLRSMQMPIILGYYPFNAFAPDSYFSIIRQVYGIPDAINEGDVLMRAASGLAKCTSCGLIFTMEEFAANIDPNTLIERCPQCQTPAFVNDENGQISQLNKVMLGMTMHMRSDGKLFIQGDNTASRENGDTQRLLKIVIDGVTGNITIQDAGDMNIVSQGNVFLGCKRLAVRSDGEIEEMSENRTTNVSQDAVEAVLNKTLTATNTLLYTAQTLSLQALGFMNLTAADRITAISGDDALNATSLTVSLSEDRVINVGTTDTENILGSRTISIGGSLGETVVGGHTLSVGGDQMITITGSSSATIGGSYTLNAVGAVTITSSAQTSINGSTVVFNGGVLPVARKTDATLIDAATDATFMTFLTDLQTILTDLQTVYNVHTHISGAPTTPTGPPVPLSTATVPTAPTSVTGKINNGNNTVLA